MLGALERVDNMDEVKPTEAPPVEKFSCCSSWMIPGTLFAIGLTYWVYRRTFGRSRRSTKTYPEETVVVYKFGASASCPFLSPFTGKLETFLRLSKIPYEKVNDRKQRSSKSKLPWIKHEGNDVADSQFCIEYLNKRFNVDLNRNMSPENRAIARAMWTMCEERIYWAMVLERWVYQTLPIWFIDMNIPAYLHKIGRHFVKKMTHAQGMGRHSQEEVYHIVRADLEALSIQLGDKPYMFGDEPVEADCSIFGVLAVIHYSLYGSVPASYIKDDFPNLAAYCERLKELAWPDWDECLRKPKQ